MERALVTDGGGVPRLVMMVWASTVARLPRRERLMWSVSLGS